MKKKTATLQKVPKTRPKMADPSPKNLMSVLHSRLRDEDSIWRVNELDGTITTNHILMAREDRVRSINQPLRCRTFGSACLGTPIRAAINITITQRHLA